MVAPLALAGLGTSSIGSIISGMEADKYHKRQRKAVQRTAGAERARQHGFQDQAGAVFSDLLAGFQPGAQRADATASREAALTGAMADAPMNVPISGSAPGVVQTEIARQMAEAMTRGQRDATGSARLGAHGDVLFDNSMRMADSGSRLSDILNFSHGSLGVLPFEQQSALNNVKQPSGLGDLLMGAGTAMNFMGSYGVQLPSFGRPAPTPSLRDIGGYMVPHNGRMVPGI